MIKTMPIYNSFSAVLVLTTTADLYITQAVPNMVDAPPILSRVDTENPREVSSSHGAVGKGGLVPSQRKASDSSVGTLATAKLVGMVMFSKPNAEVILLAKLKKRKVSFKLREEAERVGSLVSEHTFCRRVTNSRRESRSSSLMVDKYSTSGWRICL